MDFADLHCDTLYECHKTGQSLRENTLAVSLSQAGCFDRYLQTFAIWIPDDEVQPYDLYRKILTGANAQFSENRARIGRVLWRDALCACRHAAVLSVEGGRLLQGQLDRVETLYCDGVRMLTLTWNGENELAHGAHCPQGGLKPFGRMVIEKMNQLGMAPDLSHLNRASYNEAIALCRFPAASHSCFDAVNPHARNLTDEQFLELRARGGVMGLCLYPEFLGPGDVFERVYAHLAHGLSLGGEDTLAVGSDFDGAEMDERLDRLSKMPALLAYLTGRGMEKGVLRKIFYQNAVNFYMKVLTKSGNCGML